MFQQRVLFIVVSSQILRKPQHGFMKGYLSPLETCETCEDKQGKFYDETLMSIFASQVSEWLPLVYTLVDLASVYLCPEFHGQPNKYNLLNSMKTM